MARNYGLQHSDYEEAWQARRNRSPWLIWTVISIGIAIITFNLFSH